jgi:hypothetical protein
MSLSPNPNLADAEVVARLRELADMVDAVNAMLQNTFEHSEELYGLCGTLEDLCSDFEQEADELESLAK